MARILGLDHVAFPVADLDSATEFYARLFGAEIRSEHRDGDRVLVRRVSVGDALLSMHQSGNGVSLVARQAAVGCADFCFSWGGTIEEAAALLTSHDVEIIFGPVNLFTAGGAPAKSVYFRDPDGNLVELMAKDP